MAQNNIFLPRVGRKIRLATLVAVIAATGVVLANLSTTQAVVATAQFGHKTTQAPRAPQLSMQQASVSADTTRQTGATVVSSQSMTVNSVGAQVSSSVVTPTNQPISASASLASLPPPTDPVSTPNPSTGASTPPVTSYPALKPITNKYPPLPPHGPINGECAPSSPPGYMHPDYCIEYVD